MNFFDQSHCIEEGEVINIPCDYEEQVFVLSPDALNEEHRTPENQLFWCEFRVYERLVGTLLNGSPGTESFLYIAVVVKSFRYGHGPPESAGPEDLNRIDMQPEIFENGEAEEIQTSRLAMLYPGQGMRMNL